MVKISNFKFQILNFKLGTGERSCWLVVGLATLLAWHSPAWAEAAETFQLGPVVVTATRMEQPVGQVGSSVTVITREDLERKQIRTVYEALREVPGLDLTRNGGLGGQSTVFIRGAKSEHTLVLIDGMEVNDPSSTGRTFNFATLTTDQIERIEIIRGPQSTLYGSDAVGGVIHIITRKGKGKPSAFLRAEAGSYRTWEGSAGVQGGGPGYDYALTVSRMETDGISTANARDGNSERDGFQNTTLLARLGRVVNPRVRLEALARYTDAETEVDDFGGPGGDDSNRRFDERSFLLNGLIRLDLDERWSQRLSLSRYTVTRKDTDREDADHPVDTLDSHFEGTLDKVAWQHTVSLGLNNTLVAGAEWEQEAAESDYVSESAFGRFESRFDRRTATTWGIYLQDQIHVRDRFFFTAGMRWDDHSQFGDSTNFRVAVSYDVWEKGPRFHGTWGTGFKAPSLYQLYSQYGNENLQPEESASYDLGVDQAFWNGRANVGVAYFHNSFKNLIDYDFGPSRYANTGRATTRGVELEAGVQPLDTLRLLANYTRLSARDEEVGEPLLRRARYRWTFTAVYQPLTALTLDGRVLRAGPREDMDFSTFPAERVTLPAYTRVDLTASYRVGKTLTAFARMENLLDEDYEEINGYGTLGRAVYGGVRWVF